MLFLLTSGQYYLGHSAASYVKQHQQFCTQAWCRRQKFYLLIQTEHPVHRLCILYNIKKIGPNTVPWGTPQRTRVNEDLSPSKTTVWRGTA